MNLPDLPAFLSALALQSFGGENRSLPQSRTKGPTPRFNPLKVTDATRPAGGAHKPSQGPTRGSAFLGYRVRFRGAVIGKEWPGKNLPLGFRLSEPFWASSARYRGRLYDYSVVDFSSDVCH